jgi:hypothetical protein
MALSRRSFILAIGAGVLTATTGCSRDRAISAAPIDFLGDRHAPGDPLYSVDGRAFLAAFDADLLRAATPVYGADLLATCRDGVVALYDRCPFDKVRVTYCADGQTYLCETCASRYNRIGEVLGGPSPRGLDHLTIRLGNDGEVVIDRARRVDGPKAGVHVLAVPDRITEAAHCTDPTVDPATRA